MPELFEAEDIAVKMIFRLAILHRKADMDHVLRDTTIGQIFSELLLVQRSRDVLHELHVVALGIGDIEAEVSVQAGRQLGWDFYPLAGKVSPEFLGIRSFKRNV